MWLKSEYEHKLENHANRHKLEYTSSNSKD